MPSLDEMRSSLIFKSRSDKIKPDDYLGRGASIAACFAQRVSRLSPAKQEANDWIRSPGSGFRRDAGRT
jgi:hypothetical protein